MTAEELLARGRRLSRSAMWALFGGFALTVAGYVAVWYAMRTGRIADDADLPVLLPMIPCVGGLVYMLVVANRGRRLIDRSIEAVAATDVPGTPAALRIGPAHRWAYVGSIGAFLAVGAGALVVLADPAQWVCPGVMLVLVSTAIAYNGPAAAGVHIVELDATGLRLPQASMAVPWTSVRGLTVAAGRVRLRVSGPVTVAGRFGERAERRLRKLGYVDVQTARPEDLARAARQYLTAGRS
ncbi:hypothetical protein [Hamadaea tsunoensis]|uniref:hypothetical protein n=1 Tax=Hamadaea tsunoensis TaxID=53368 RepID=UPI00041E7D9D|nr:hypothetical protein [Hamadaea tsunoensis]